MFDFATRELVSQHLLASEVNGVQSEFNLQIEIERVALFCNLIGAASWLKLALFVNREGGRGLRQG